MTKRENKYFKIKKFKKIYKEIKKVMKGGGEYVLIDGTAFYTQPFTIN